jgi:hypothetical protein
VCPDRATPMAISAITIKGRAGTTARAIFFAVCRYEGRLLLKVLYPPVPAQGQVLRQDG